MLQQSDNHQPPSQPHLVQPNHHPTVPKPAIVPTNQDNPLPASDSNRARQKRSRLNITHPVRFADENLEKTYNQRRKITNKDRKSELRKLH